MHRSLAKQTTVVRIIGIRWHRTDHVRGVNVFHRRLFALGARVFVRELRERIKWTMSVWCANAHSAGDTTDLGFEVFSDLVLHEFA